MSKLTFAGFIAQHRPAANLFRDKVLSKELLYNETGFSIAPSIKYHNHADIVELYLIGTCLAEGPVVFKPKQAHLELLELVDLNLTLDDFELPFPTVVVELPPDYVQKCTVADPVKNGLPHSPGLCFLRKELDALFIGVVYDSGESIKVIVKAQDGEVENSLKSFAAGDEFANCLEQSQDEWDVTKRVIRACLNFILLVEETGSKKLPDTPHRQRLQRRVDRGVGDRNELKAEPVYYELAQKVVLATRSSEPTEKCDPSGKTVRPHRRRGHYRMQVHGAGRSERKRIRVPPCFVNWHLFAGTLDKAFSEYIK
jgi:hypothetical protein